MIEPGHERRSDAPAVRPRVLHLITGLATGGAELMLLKLMTSELARGYQCSVLSLTGGGTVGPRLAALGVPVYALGLRRGALSPWALVRLRRLVRAARPQLVQGWMHHGNLAAWAAAPRGVPVAWNVRQTLPDLRRERVQMRWLLRALAWVSPRVAAGVYNSAAGAEQHGALGLRERRRRVIPNGFDLDCFRPDPAARASVRAELGLAPGVPLVGLIGRWHPMKDHAGFLAAAARVAASHPQVRFLLAGHGVTADNPELRVQVAAGGLEEKVFLLGERSDVPRLTAALDLACSASRHSEGFSNVVGEAMACAVPCVVTGLGEAPQVVADTGLVVPPADPPALAAAVASLLALPAAERQALGAAARRRMVEHYALPRVAAMYDALYRELLDAAA